MKPQKLSHISINLSLIIPNQCHSLHDKAEAGKCFNDTIERITNYLHGHKQVITNCCTIAKPNEYNCIEYSFEIPLLNITANMFAGFWDIWPAARYSQYFYPYGKDMLGNPKIWTRDVCFDTLLAFGQHEGWICDECHTWNSCLNFETGSFESWRAYGKSPDDSRIYEFNIMDFAEVNPKTRKYATYQHKIHDEYKEHHDVIKFLRKRFPQYDIQEYYQASPDRSRIYATFTNAKLLQKYQRTIVYHSIYSVSNVAQRSSLQLL